MVRSTFRSWDVGKVPDVVARSTSRSQNAKTTRCSRHFWTLKRRFVAGARDSAPSHKWTKREGFCSSVAFPKTMAGAGNLKRICKDWFRATGAVQETCSSEMLGGQGADFLRGLHFGALDRQVCKDRCSILYDLASLFRDRQSTLHWWSGNIAKRIGTRPSALHFNFSFLNEVSQKCLVFDVVKIENWGSLTELLRFWSRQVQKMRMSLRIASFSNLQKHR